uniref:Uncharacterized protein n=2 Tax=Magallana gigas TaxID=29159 RepID=A0A8W8I242_MAGGI|nr:interaptin isoform X1 [Crassostrea gigas]
MNRTLHKIFLLFSRKHDQTYRPCNKMPPFTNSLQKLQESLNDLKSEIDKYHCPKCGVGLESYEESNSATVAPSYKQLEDIILELQDKCESLTLKNNKYEEKIADQEHTIGEQFRVIDQQRETKLKQESLDELERTISEQQAEISQLKEAAKAFAVEKQKLNREISEKDKHIEHLNYTQKMNKEKLDESIQRLGDENKHYKEKLKSCQSEFDKLSAKLAEKDRIKNDLVSRRLEIEEKCKQLERDLEQRSRKEIGVGFHTTVAPSMSSLILGGLTSRLTDRLAGEKVDLVRQAYSGGPDVHFPLLVVCVNVSRIGADAKEALKGIPKAKDVALLVFHHKEAHALPSQTSDKILTGADFSGLGSIIDLAFLSQRGIYECDMNNVGIERVASFLLQYKTQRK